MTHINSPDDRRGAAERALLAALCQGSLATRGRETVLRRLARHRFSSPEHEVVFQAASELRGESGAGESIGGLVMANLTRRGFPDMDIEPFLSAAAPTEADLPSLFSDL